MSTIERIKGRFTAIDSLRATAILGVLVLHSDLEGLTDSSRRAILGVFDWSVLAFFLISGYLHNYQTPLIHVFRKRFVVLVGPFMLYNILYNLVFTVISRSPAITLTNSGVGPHWWCWPFTSPAFHLYFLPYLFAITVLGHAILGRLGETTRRRSAVATLVFLPLLYLILPTPIISHGSSLTVVPFYIASFLLGGLLRVSSIWQSGWAFALSGIALAPLIFGSSLFVHPCLSLAVASVLFILLSNNRARVYGRGIALVGRCSGSIYLWHTPLLMPAVSVGLSKCGLVGSSLWLWNIAITLVFCIGVRITLEKVVSRKFGCSLPRVVTL